MIDFLIDVAFSTGRLESAMLYASIGAIAGAVGVLIATAFEKIFKKKLNIIVVLVIMIAISSRIPDLIRPWLLENYPEKVSLKENMIVVEELNKSTPIKLDEVTTLSYAEGTAQGITYHFNLSFSINEIEDMKLFDSQMKSNVVSLACNESQVKNILQMGKILTYKYYDNSDVLIATFDINENSCIK